MINSVRGFRDILYPDSRLFAEFENKARGLFERYSFREVRLPTLERMELFIKSTGETSDIVEKEMYFLRDAGGRELALRPEGTPGAVRAYLENNLCQSNPVQKLFYIGNMFRAERPQAGRFREFEQIGAEYFGNPSPWADIEMIVLLADLLNKFEIKFELHVNSLGCEHCRPLYREELKACLENNKEALCENCRNRIARNPIRALDCKIDGPNLIQQAPKIKLCDNCGLHFEKFKSWFAAKKEMKIIYNAGLVRGLDYYTGIVFEVKSPSLGAQDAIGAGGRYDTLVKSMGGPDVPAVGWALGVDRCLMAAATPPSIPRVPEVFVATMGDYSAEAFSLLENLRGAGISSDAAVLTNSFKSQMRSADKSGAAFLVIIGEDEIKGNSYSVKNLATGEQKKVPSGEITAFLKTGQRVSPNSSVDPLQFPSPLRGEGEGEGENNKP